MCTFSGIGQAYSCNIHYLLARGTCDDLMWPLISKKLQVIGQAISGDEMHMEIDENRTYTSIDHEQKQLTGFYRQDQGMEEHDEPSADLIDRAAMDESKYAGDDDEDGLFHKPDPRSAPSSASSSKSRSPRARPRKKPRTLLTKKSAASSSSSAGGGESSAMDDESFPELEHTQDNDDDDDLIDMTVLTPSTTRSTVPSVGTSASSVKSLISAPLPVRRQRGVMLAAFSSPNPKPANDAADALMEPVEEKNVPMETGEANEEEIELQEKKKRKPKRKVISSDDDEDAAEESGSLVEVKPAAPDSPNRLSAEPEIVIPPSDDDDADFEHVPPPEQLKPPSPVKSAPAVKAPLLKPLVPSKPTPLSKLTPTKDVTSKSSKPSAKPIEDDAFPELEDDGDFLEDMEDV
jgi:hypothetical protein